MAGKQIQEQFGERVIAAFADFARGDLEQPGELETATFNHIHEPKLRKELAQVFYGARWIYKLGLALLTRNEERAAHVRAQIVDYAAIAEALMSYTVLHALKNGYEKGTSYMYSDPDKQSRPLRWKTGNPDTIIARQSLWWLVKVAAEFKIIDSRLEYELQWLREQRNTVHLRARAAMGPTAFLNQSKRAFEATTGAIVQSRAWKIGHP
jgi:hypothetical protein